MTNNTFINRINYLSNRQGVDRQAQFYGVSRRTINRWRAGETTPSRRTVESVRTRGLRAGSPRAEPRRVNGRFVQAERGIDTGNFNTIARINQGLRNRRTAAIRAARLTGSTPRLREAQSMPTRLTQRESRVITNQRTELINRDNLVELESQGISPDSPRGREVMGEPPEGYPEWADYDYPEDYEDDWETWRSNYEQMAG